MRIYAFGSVKGGVGKSALAVTCAKLLAASGRTCVLIDADLTSTSLADGLRLCAPVVATRPQGGMDLTAPPTGQFLTRDETLSARDARKREGWDDVAPAPPFLNDILIHGHEETLHGAISIEECRVKALLWRHEADDGVLYLPSSPLRKDVEIALGWLYRGKRYTWIQRMTWLFVGMRQQMPELTDVVIDLPPGVFGFSLEVMSLLAHLSHEDPLPTGFPDLLTRERWEARPFLVTTQDRNDLIVAMEYWMSQKGRLPTLVPLVNKRTEGLESIREAVRARLRDEAIDPSPALRSVDHLPATLGEIFMSAGNVELTPEIRALVDVIGAGEGGRR